MDTILTDEQIEALRQRHNIGLSLFPHEVRALLAALDAARTEAVDEKLAAAALLEQNQELLPAL
jgi:hypothetical protein